MLIVFVGIAFALLASTTARARPAVDSSARSRSASRRRPRCRLSFMLAAAQRQAGDVPRRWPARLVLTLGDRRWSPSAATR